MTILGYRVPMMASLLVWCVLWEIAGRAGLTFFLPPLSAVLAAMVTLVQSASWQTATIVTAHSFALGMAIAIGAGIRSAC